MKRIEPLNRQHNHNVHSILLQACMAPPKSNKKQVKGQKKEKVFHPQSRKADQLVRAQHRKHKLEEQAKARHHKQREQGAHI